MLKEKNQSQKTKIVIIHGYAEGVKTSISNKLNLNIWKNFDKDLDFKAFTASIESGEARIFFWREILNVKLIVYLKVKTYTNLYRYEKEKAVSKEIQNKLSKFLEESSPEIIICHSIGCYLILNYIEKNDLIDTVKFIFLVQGDFDRKYKIENIDIKERIENKNLFIINCYCPWDQALLISPFLNNLAILAGLLKTNNPLFIDKFFPLRKIPNFHKSSMSDKKFYEFINNFAIELEKSAALSLKL